MGEVKEDAISVPGWGRRFWFLATALRDGSVSIYSILSSGAAFSPPFDSVNLNIHPPDAGYAQYGP